MSERRPPPRPPPPPRPTAKAGQTSNSQGKYRDPFASISIRYNTSKDSDSEEEISIVRKADEPSPDVHENHSNDKDSQAGEVTRETQEIITNPGGFGQNRRAIQKKSTSEADCRFHNSKEKRPPITSVKRQSWPAASSQPNSTESGGPMKFLRGREANSRSDEASKIPPEDTEPAPQPVKSHLQATGNDVPPRSRSPSPFRRYRQEMTPSRKSGISLSSLLAADRTGENSSTSSDDEEGSLQDCWSEPPSSPERISKSAVVKRDSLTSKSDGLLEGSRFVDRGPDVSTFCFCILAVYVYYTSTPPPFLSGMFTGVILTYLAGCLALWLFCPHDTNAARFHRELLDYEERRANFLARDYKSLDPGLLHGNRELKGWMYKAYDYKPETFDFSSETTPVFANLKGNKLTLSHPNLTNTTKRFDPRTAEDDGSVSFLRHEFFDISGSSVSLLPHTLTIKRLWSKKCPICLELGSPGAETEEMLANVDEEGDRPALERMKSHKSFEDVEKLYLFPRTGREKEDWYHHLCKTLKPDQTGTATSDVDEYLRPSCSYPHYMTKLLDDSQHQELQLAWVNVMFGRAFWDVWQSQYWADKIRMRFQNKLSKMRKPQFIKDISIADLSLGQSLPIIKCASPPVVDERGTWVDLDVVYDGVRPLVFTLEGHLNVEGYLRYFIDLGRGGKSAAAAELEMVELQKKYNLEEDEDSVIITAKSEKKDDLEDDVESESPPLSDSDFESPESDVEEFASSDCQSLPSSPALSPKVDVFHNAVESSSTGSDDTEKASNKAYFFEAMPGPNSQTQSSFDEPDSGMVSPQSSKQTGEKQTGENSSRSSQVTHAAMAPKSGAKKKIFDVIERLAKSKWVKKAVETDLVRRAAEKFSNVPIILSVEVITIKGTIALNIPPPPTNRLWFGFRDHPMLFVCAKPKLGERQVKLTHVTDWIEKKLKHEFKNMFVLPNMEDLPIKLMNSGFEGQFPEH